MPPHALLSAPLFSTARRLLDFIDAFFNSNADDASVDTGTERRKLSASPTHARGKEIVKRGRVMRAVKNAMNTPSTSTMRRLDENCEDNSPLLSFEVTDFLTINFDFGACIH